MNRPMSQWIRLSLAALALMFIAACGKDKPVAPAAAPAVEAEAPVDEAAVKKEAEAAAEKTITADNADKAADELEAKIEAELAQ